jgi:hypothetical protein
MQAYASRLIEHLAERREGRSRRSLSGSALGPLIKRSIDHPLESQNFVEAQTPCCVKAIPILAREPFELHLDLRKQAFRLAAQESLKQHKRPPRVYRRKYVLVTDYRPTHLKFFDMIAFYSNEVMPHQKAKDASMYATSRLFDWWGIRGSPT